MYPTNAAPPPPAVPETATGSCPVSAAHIEQFRAAIERWDEEAKRNA